MHCRLRQALFYIKGKPPYTRALESLFEVTSIHTRLAISKRETEVEVPGLRSLGSTQQSTR